MSEEGPIQSNVGDRINAVKFQNHPVGRKDLLLRNEMLCEQKIIFHELQCIQLIVPPVRIRHQTVLQQAGVHTARDGCRNRIRSDVIDIVFRNGQHPSG